jgi:hypothetical protein
MEGVKLFIKIVLHMKVNGYRDNFMVKVYINGMMELIMKEPINMVRSMEMESINILLKIFIKVNGYKVINME